MANFTIELRTLLQTDFQIALNEYPIFDESYRAVLNQKIIDHYYFDEIGLETPDRFNHRLKTRMNEIMPYYNKLYQIQAANNEPLSNYNLTETQQRTVDGENKGSTQTTGSTGQTIKKGDIKQKAVKSDTPQGSTTIFNLDSGGYATEVNQTEQTFPTDDIVSGTAAGNVNSSGTAKTTEQFILQRIGYQGITPSELVNEYISSLRRIDMMIISELSDLFMMVW
jgi:hypothetical protein